MQYPLYDKCNTEDCKILFLIIINSEYYHHEHIGIIGVSMTTNVPKLTIKN